MIAHFNYPIYDGSIVNDRLESVIRCKGWSVGQENASIRSKSLFVFPDFHISMICGNFGVAGWSW